MMRFRLLFGWLLLVGPLAAAELRELGPELGYLRLSRLDEEIPPAASPVIVDLRYATSLDDSDLRQLGSFLSASGPLRLVLYDASPPAALRTVLPQRAANVLTLAPASADPRPDLPVTVEPEVDQRAHAALDQGVDLIALLGPTIEKRRYDEAALVRARAGHGSLASPAAQADPVEPEATPPGPREATPTAPALVDAVLQQAVHVAKGLEALGYPRSTAPAPGSKR